MSRSATTRQAIIEELAKNGPMTYLELAEALGMPRYSIADAVQYSRRHHGNTHFRVERWSLGPSGPVAHWGLGPKKDAPKPAARTPSDRRRAYRERHPVQKRIIDRLWNARRRGTTPTPASWIDTLKGA